jgi:hypothetical protein
MTIPIEERFDRWVQEGKFHKEIVTEPLRDNVKHCYLGLLRRTLEAYVSGTVTYDEYLTYKSTHVAWKSLARAIQGH